MKVIDLFSGAGGLSLGVKRAGFEIVACVEINRDAMDTYISHDADATHFNQDVRSVDFRRYRGIADLVIGGPPCQPFSVGGLRRASDDSRDMIPEFIRCLDEAQPEVFLLENVPGLLLKRARPYFESVLTRLASRGYILNWAVLNSADYGIPQRRRRLFVMGSKRNQLKFPQPSHGPDASVPHVRALDILGNEPIGEAPNCQVKFAKFPDLRPSPYAGHIYNGGGRPIDPDGPSHTILASSGGYKTHWIDTENVAPDYHRYLMSGGPPRAGAVPGARRLSVEECAILQTFPRELKFRGRRSAQYIQVGDAVPPDLAYSVAVSLRDQMQGASLSGSMKEAFARTSIQGRFYF
ncbi:MAG: DNA (cytosine-5-)-methyltransferase [SAR202 cluster bacterium]|nr:DNA (cytosine-5-)-methyltransferase [SAR202 cluster bacterium]